MSLFKTAFVISQGLCCGNRRGLEEIERADALFWDQKAAFWQGTASFGQGESVCSHFGPGGILGELRPGLPEGCQENAAGLRMLKPHQSCTLEALRALLASRGAQLQRNPRKMHHNQAGKRKSSIPELGWALVALPWRGQRHCASCDTDMVTALARAGELCVHCPL